MGIDYAFYPLPDQGAGLRVDADVFCIRNLLDTDNYVHVHLTVQRE
jgi:hypothetical protein